MFKNFAFAAAGLVFAAGTVFAESHVDKAIAGAISARQSHMTLNGFNVGSLFAMANGNVAYDPEAAKAAAGNLVALSNMSQAGYWPEGSDADSVENTRALPAIWQNMADVETKLSAVHEAAVALEAVAGDGVDPMKAALGPVGDACSACHKAYQQPK